MRRATVLVVGVLNCVELFGIKCSSVQYKILVRKVVNLFCSPALAIQVLALLWV